jgi:hypothetical protein
LYNLCLQEDPILTLLYLKTGVDRGSGGGDDCGDCRVGGVDLGDCRGVDRDVGVERVGDDCNVVDCIGVVVDCHVDVGGCWCWCWWMEPH